MKTTSLSLDLLKTDTGTQCRISINEETVAEYTEILAETNGEWPFPPLDVFHDGTDYHVSDGFHRILAALRAKKKEAPCKIHQGTAHDARIFGMTANDHHGLRMTRADKRACVVWLLENGGKMTQVEIAEKAGVTVRFVRDIVSSRNPDSMRGKFAEAMKGNPTTLPGGKGNNSSGAPISGDRQERAMKKHPAGESLGMPCPNCGVDWWFNNACGGCLHPIEEAPGEDADSAGTPEESDSQPSRNGTEKLAVVSASQARDQIGIWQEAVRKWLTAIDSYRELFPGPVGDRTIDAAKELFEALTAWKKGLK
jgi:hypothetical protein